MRHVILNVHGIGPPARVPDPGEASYWISRELFSAAVDMAVEASVQVSFTFDDGNLSDLSIATPILDRAGLKARFFVLAGRIGETGSLGEKDIQALHAAGHVIGSHGWDHADWCALDAAGRHREFYTARECLSEICGHPVTEAAIPFGHYNGAVIRALKKAGYARVYSSDGGPARPGAYPTPRTSLQGDMHPGDIKALIAGREPLARRARRSLAMRVKRVI